MSNAHGVDCKLPSVRGAKVMSRQTHWESARRDLQLQLATRSGTN